MKTNRWLTAIAVLTLAAAPLTAKPPGGPEGPGGPRGPGGPGGPGGPPHERPRGGDERGGRMITVGYLGVATTPVTPEMAAQLKLPRGVGLAVVHVMPDSPAAAAGLVEHDVLHKLDDQIIVNPDQLRTLVQNRAAGDTVTLTLIRQAQPMTQTATIAQQEIPEHEAFGPPRHGPPPFAGGGPGKGPKADREGRGGPPHEKDGREPGGPGGPKGPAGKGEDRGPDGPGGPKGPAGMREIGGKHLMSGSAMYRDSEHELQLTITDGRRTLVAKDAAGNELYNGPVDTPEQREALPEAVRSKLGKLEKMRESRPLPMERGLRHGIGDDAL